MLRKEMMLEATAIELRMESLELHTLLRTNALPILAPDSVQEVLDGVQKNIRLANEMRTFYFEEQTQERRLLQDTKAHTRMFEVLEKAGVLEKIMKKPV
jgi:hypothetical protein